MSQSILLVSVLIRATLVPNYLHSHSHHRGEWVVSTRAGASGGRVALDSRFRGRPSRGFRPSCQPELFKPLHASVPDQASR